MCANEEASLAAKAAPLKRVVGFKIFKVFMRGKKATLNVDGWMVYVQSYYEIQFLALHLLA